MGIVKTDTGKVLLGTSTKDIHQLWEGPVKKRAVYLGDVHVWPNYYIWGYENSVNITGVSNPPRVNNVSNGAIGNTYEVDPAGASGYVRVRSVESSFWHMISFDIEYSSSMTINNISCGNGGSSSATIGNVQITNTGEKHQSVKLSEDILPSEEQGWDCNIQFNIEVNSNTSDRTGYIKIVSYYDEFNIKHICDVLLFEWNQKPNTLYGYDIYWSELNPIESEILYTVSFYNGSTLLQSTTGNSTTPVVVPKKTDGSDYTWSTDPNSSDSTIVVSTHSVNIIYYVISSAPEPDEPERIYHNFTTVIEIEPYSFIGAPEGEEHMVNGNEIKIIESPFTLETKATLPFSWFGSRIPTVRGTGSMNPTSVSVNPTPVPNIMKTQDVKFTISGTEKFYQKKDEAPFWNHSRGTIIVEMGEYYTYQ